MIACVFGLTACDGEETLRESDIANLEKAEVISVNLVLPYLCTFEDDAEADAFLEEYTKEEVQYVAESVFYTLLNYDTEMAGSGISFSYKTMINVPAPIKTHPMKDLTVNCSCKNTKASTSVITTLSLSMGTTFEASPICKAL